MAPDSDRIARWATFALMGLAYATCEVAAHPDGRPRLFGVIFGLTLFSLAIVVNWCFSSSRGQPPRLLTVVFAVVLVLPVLGEPLLREWTGSGFPLELQLVNGFRNLGLALTAASGWPSCRKVAGVSALFLALFASAMGDQPAIPYLLGAMAVVGGVWLILNHRSGLSHTAVGQVVANEVEQVRLRLSIREFIVFGTLSAAAVGILVVRPKQAATHLGEWMPTSGGTGQYDLFARFGTGDGNEEVAGDDAKAGGMVDSDRMIEDTKDTLIDVIGDLYGEAHKPREQQERMIAAGQADVIQHHGPLPENRRPNRDFDIARKGPRGGRTPGSEGARAIFEIEGRTPLHVRVIAYEHYDAATRRWEEGRKLTAPYLEPDEKGDDWMRFVLDRGTSWYAAEDRHRFKIADLKSNLIPTPAMMSRIRIRRVSKPEYYEWDYDGVLTVAGRKTMPPGVVVHTDCRTLDPNRLPVTAFSTAGNSGLAAKLSNVAVELQPSFRHLAAEWAGDQPRGWPQVSAILARLRAEYTLDRRATAPADHQAPVLWFLNESRRGPDYFFAAAAALILRSLGYQTRICLGYYAGPDAYDPDTDHTPVRETDLHFWPELLLTDGHWLIVEPTPGYSVLPPRQSMREQLIATASSFARWGERNAVGIAAGVLFLTVCAWQRRRIADVLFTLTWRLYPGRTWRQIVLRSLRLLEHRGRLAGCPRRRDETLALWAGRLQSQAGVDSELADLIRWGERAAYAPGLEPMQATDRISVDCHRVIASWTYRRLVSARPIPAMEELE